MNLIIQKLFLIIFLLQSLVGVDYVKLDSIMPQIFNNQIDYQTKLGQILMFNLWPNTKEDFIRSLIKDYKINNFNLIGSYYNEQSVKQVIDLIYDETKKNALSTPIIAVDEEGYIKRLIFLNSTDQKDLQSYDDAYSEAYRRGKKLKELGINMVFSPVLDFTEDQNDYIWPRTFQKNKRTTIELGKAMIKGYQDAGIIAVAKHFPGYINQKTDPHASNSSLYYFSDYQESREVFEQIIKGEMPYGLMMAHVVINDFGPKPITREKEFVQYLTNQLNYYGLLVTDSLGMQSFRTDSSFEQATLEALLANYDLLILSSNQEVSVSVIKYLINSLDNPNVQQAIDSAFLKRYFVKQFVGN